MWHKPCRTFHPWCPCIKTRCLWDIFCIPKKHSLRWRCRHCDEISITTCTSRICHFVNIRCSQRRQISQNDHCTDVIMSAMASQITGVSIVCSTVGSDADRKISKLRVTGLCAGNSPVTCEFPAQKASEAENVSIWWRHHATFPSQWCVRNRIACRDWGKEVYRISHKICTLFGCAFFLLCIHHYHLNDFFVFHLSVFLTPLPLDKMADILADDIFKWIFLNENDRIPIQISLKFVPRSSVDNKQASVQVTAWRWTGDTSLPEPMLTHFTDAYICGTRGIWV